MGACLYWRAPFLGQGISNFCVLGVWITTKRKFYCVLGHAVLEFTAKHVFLRSGGVELVVIDAGGFLI